MEVKELQDQLSDIKEKISVIEHDLGERYIGPLVKEPPVREYKQIIKDSEDPGYINRVLFGTAATGLVRIEWVAAKYGMLTPPNWAMVQMNQYVNTYITLRYQVDDAQNLIVRAFMEGDYEWLILHEHDVVLHPETIRIFNRHIQEGNKPIVSGLYYTRSRPSEPLIYRGRGTGFYGDWNFGDIVWCDGVPTGVLLIHRSIIKELWDTSEEYIIQHPSGTRDVTRAVFNTPRDFWLDQETGQYNTMSGTSDLNWCTRVMNEDIFTKAGWPEYKDMKYPFPVDTNIFCRHINNDGEQFP